MSWPRVLVLVRHAESEGNLRTTDERALWDVPTYEYALTERGKTQAFITGEHLRNRYGEFDVYYVSYYRRSKETMAIMYPKAHVYEDPRLAEAQRGIWQTMTREQIVQRFPEELQRKEKEGPYHFRPLGGENWPDVELRIHSFLGTLSRDYADQKVLIVVHGHWLILFKRLVERFSIEEAVSRYQSQVPENASVTLYEGVFEHGRGRLIFRNYVVPWKEKI